MNNYEHIKTMTLEEMAELFGEYYGRDDFCTRCINLYPDCYDKKTKKSHCTKWIKKWLMKDVEN